jgi:hypothetical protein
MFRILSLYYAYKHLLAIDGEVKLKRGWAKRLVCGGRPSMRLALDWAVRAPQDPFKWTNETRNVRKEYPRSADDRYS